MMLSEAPCINVRRRRENLPAKSSLGGEVGAVRIVSRRIFLGLCRVTIFNTDIHNVHIYYRYLVARAIKQTKSTLSNSSACVGKFICSGRFVRGRLSRVLSRRLLQFNFRAVSAPVVIILLLSHNGFK